MLVVSVSSAYALWATARQGLVRRRIRAHRTTTPRRSTPSPFASEGDSWGEKETPREITHKKRYAFFMGPDIAG